MVGTSDFFDRLRSVPHRLRRLPGRVEHLVRAVATDPGEVLLYLPERISQRWSYPVGYVIEEEWQTRLHRMLGAPWPCPESSAFDEVWSAITTELAGRALDVGRYTYGGFSDGDP